MLVRCSYCETDLGQKEPLGQDDISHSICDDCFEYFTDQWSGKDLSEYLDRFEKPVLVVNSDRRVVAFNKQLEEMTGKSYREMAGLRGGEALECAYARLPGGCGKSVHCQTCTIRNTVLETMASGLSQKNINAYLFQEDQCLDVVISTFKIDNTIRVVIDHVIVRENPQTCENQPVSRN
ncbi:MAG: hypothetical protein GF404_09170 [candidate division Zixibacteria bacterium]|nr:hypothetical protein [candidate division Zixibacteria bacterium]